MERKNSPGCKCCCTAPCVTIEGYTASGSWLEKTPDAGDDCSSCCWSRTFLLDDPASNETNDCVNVCNNGTNSRFIVHKRIRLATRVDVYVSQSACECDPEPAGGKWFVSVRIYDGVTYFVWWNFGGLFGPVPTCAIPCPPVACNQFVCPGCEWYSLGQCRSETVIWTRTKLLTSAPSGSLTFGDSDILSCLFNSYPNLYDIPCFTGPFKETTEDECVTVDLVDCVNDQTSQPGSGIGYQCTGTSNDTVCFESPSLTISFC